MGHCPAVSKPTHTPDFTFTGSRRGGPTQRVRRAAQNLGWGGKGRPPPSRPRWSPLVSPAANCNRRATSRRAPGRPSSPVCRRAWALSRTGLALSTHTGPDAATALTMRKRPPTTKPTGGARSSAQQLTATAAPPRAWSAALARRQLATRCSCCPPQAGCCLAGQRRHAARVGRRLYGQLGLAHT
jgi:hypothetical protein